MRGASRDAFESLRDQLDGVLTSAGQARNVGEGLFAVTGLLDTEHGLRRALSDPGKPAAEKAAIAGQLLHGKITQVTEDLVTSAAGKHWASSADLADAIEELGIESLARVAEYENTLDDLEDELFRFGRLVLAQPELRNALTSSAPAQAKEHLLSGLLDGKATKVAQNLITQVVLHPRGRSLPAALDLCAQIAADRRQQLIAVVRVARDLSAGQKTRLAAALSSAYGHKIHLNILIDPAVVGGISIQIGDELIDSTAAARLAAVRRQLAG
jgi:F-type H+-transporting ATPase subunit delta